MGTGLFFVEFSIFDEVEAEISPGHQIHQQVEIFSVLESEQGVDEEVMFEAF